MTIIPSLDAMLEILNVNLFMVKNKLNDVSSLPIVSTFDLREAHSHHFHQKLYMQLEMSTQRFGLLAHTLIQL